MTLHNLQIDHIIHYCEANDHHNLQINHIIHYCEANDTSQPTNIISYITVKLMTPHTANDTSQPQINHIIHTVKLMIITLL